MITDPAQEFEEVCRRCAIRPIRDDEVVKKKECTFSGCFDRLLFRLSWVEQISVIVAFIAAAGIISGLIMSSSNQSVWGFVVMFVVAVVVYLTFVVKVSDWGRVPIDPMSANLPLEVKAKVLTVQDAYKRKGEVLHIFLEEVGDEIFVGGSVHRGKQYYITKFRRAEDL